MRSGKGASDAAGLFHRVGNLAGCAVASVIIGTSRLRVLFGDLDADGRMRAQQVRPCRPKSCGSSPGFLLVTRPAVETFAQRLSAPLADGEAAGLQLVHQLRHGRAVATVGIESARSKFDDT